LPDLIAKVYCQTQLSSQIASGLVRSGKDQIFQKITLLFESYRNDEIIKIKLSVCIDYAMFCLESNINWQIFLEKIPSVARIRTSCCIYTQHSASNLNFFFFLKPKHFG
jgi:hypothetical protein